MYYILPLSLCNVLELKVRRSRRSRRKRREGGREEKEEGGGGEEEEEEVRPDSVGSTSGADSSAISPHTLIEGESHEHHFPLVA